MHRRSLLQAGVAAPFALAARSADAQPPGVPAGSGKTYVLVHGSWCGGWFWAPVAERLRAQGNRVFTPTQTGLGERRHLLSRDITLDTFILDVVNLIRAEELEDVILVGHSFGGLAITGVADSMPERIRRLVHLDTIIVQNGQSFFDAVPPGFADALRKAAQDSSDGITVPLPSDDVIKALGIQEGPIREWLLREWAPHPIATYETPLRLRHPVGNGRPCTYVAFTNPPLPLAAASQHFARSQHGWSWAELAAGHVAPVTAPDDVVQLLSASV